MAERILVLGSGNPGKVREIRQLLADLAVDLRTPADYPHLPRVREDGETFEANALLKARAVQAATGHFALAEDSGIEVDALGGFPGVRSARFIEGSDADRTARLVQLLAGVPDDKRGARYVSVVAIVTPDGIEYTIRGTLSGRIGHAPRGTGGFGYDPVFLLPDGRTTAEISLAEKNAISHRGRALAAARPIFTHLWGG